MPSCSYFTVMAEVALIDATAKTQQLAQARDASNCHLFGVPISIKDLNPVAGVPVVMDLVLRNELPTYDDGVVTRISWFYYFGQNSHV